MKKILLIGLAAILASCAQDDSSQVSSEPASVEVVAEKPAPNIMVIIGDDMGQETIGCYGVGDAPAHTPTLNSMCNQGVRFDNFWTQPVCSPTRATIMTGEYGFRNGVISAVFPNIDLGLDKPPLQDNELLFMQIDPAQMPEQMAAQFTEMLMASRGLKQDAVTLPMLLQQSDAGYATGAFGKWHLADWTNGGINHPHIVGFDHYSGDLDGTIPSYYGWRHVENGETELREGYFTTNMVSNAINWINDQEKPWFAWMAFVAPHEPFHKPPQELLLTEESKALDPLAINEENVRDYYLAQLESFDAEVKRLIDSIPAQELANTYIFFLGDNGSPTEVAIPPYTSKKVKMSLYEGGINMPFFVTGPDVTNGIAEQITNSTDLFISILELAGVDVSEAIPEGVGVHSVSLNNYLKNTKAEPARDYIYADTMLGFGPAQSNGYTIRNLQYKYLNTGKEELFFDLIADPYENTNLMDSELTAEQQAEFDKLKAEATALRES